MEKQPKAAEVYTGEVIDDDTHKVESSITAEEDESFEKKALFDFKISRGQKTYDAIIRTTSASETEFDFDSLPTKQKLLYSLFEDKPKTSNQPPVRIANIDCHGFHIEDKTFDFNSDLRYDLHRHVMATIAEGASSEEEFYDKLRDANREYYDFFADITKKSIIDEEKRLFNKKKTEITDKYNWNNTRVSPETIMYDKISELCPDLDKEIIKDAQSKLKKCQSRAKSNRENLEENLKDYISEKRSLSKKIKKESEKNGGRKSEEDIIESYSKTISETEKKLGSELLFAKKEILSQETKKAIAESLNVAIDSPEVNKIINSFNKYGWESSDETIDTIHKGYLKKIERLNPEDLFRDFVKDNQELFNNACDYDGQDILKGEIEIRFHELFENIDRLSDKDYEKSYAIQNEALFDISKRTSHALFETDYKQIFEKMRRDHLTDSKNGTMTEEEYDELQRIKNSNCTSGSISKDLQETYRAVNNRRANDSVVQNIDSATIALHIAVLRNELDNFNKSEYNFPLEVFENTIENKLDEEVKKLSKNSESEIKRLSHMSIEEAKTELINIIYPGEGPKRKGAANRINEEAERLRRRNELERKYRDGDANFGISLSTDNRVKMQAEIDAEYALYEHRMDQRIGQNLDTEIRQSIQTFGQKAFGIDNTEEILIFPTGLAIRNNTNHFALIPFDVAWQDNISENMSKKHQDIWHKILRSDQLNDNKYDTIVRDYINHLIQDEYDNGSEFLPNNEKTINDICSKDNIEQPAAININTGELSTQLSELDARNADELHAEYGRYIESFDVSSSYFFSVHKNDSLQKYIKDYILNGQYNMLFCRKGANKNRPLINIKEYSDCRAQYGDKETEALLVSGISAFVYNQNEDKIFPIMKKILGERANLSPVDSIRLTGQKINNPEERRKISCRAYFVSSFNSFLRGKEITEPQMANLVARLDKMLFDEQE